MISQGTKEADHPFGVQHLSKHAAWQEQRTLPGAPGAEAVQGQVGVTHRLAQVPGRVAAGQARAQGAQRV